VSSEDFDNLTRALANRTISRRRALRLAAASVLGAAGLGVAAREAEAAPRCPRRGSGCLRKCRNTRKLCFCIRTVSGRRRCVHPCCSGRRCNSGDDCRRTEVCMRTGCCPEQPTCVTLCTERRPDYCGEGGMGASGRSSTAWS
jgi:hypothetical protein